MTATNQQMTSEQLADLSTLAAQFQAKAEANDDRDTAVMAYAVQRACSDLEESRREFTAANATIHNLELKVEQVVAENAAMKNPDNWLSLSDYGYEASEVADSNGASEDEALRAGMTAIINRITTPATDAHLAEVRAQGVEMLLASLPPYYTARADIEEFAAQLRQGAEQ